MIFNPLHAAPNDFFVWLAFLLIFGLLYLEQRKAWRSRLAEDPAWGKPAANDAEFHARILVALKRDKKKDDAYILRAWILAIIGSVSLLFAVLYALLVSGVI
jgi:hypothetical protein